MNLRQRIVGISTAITLFLHSALTVLLTSMAVAQAQSYSDQDRVLICTGSNMKWVSLSQTELAGEFVFIDPPEEAVQFQYELDCASEVLLQLTDFDHVVPVSELVTRLTQGAVNENLYSAAETQWHAISAQPRAPPFTAFTV